MTSLKDINKKGDHTVISLADGINYFNISQVRSELMKLAEEVDAGIVLDLGRVGYIDSSALGLFAMLHQKLESLNRKLILVNVDDKILDMLKLSTLNEFINVSDSLEDIV